MASLGRLPTGHVDLLYPHRVDPAGTDRGDIEAEILPTARELGIGIVPSDRPGLSGLGIPRIRPIRLSRRLRDLAHDCLRLPALPRCRRRLEFLDAAFAFEAELVHRGESGRIEHAHVTAGKSLIMVGEHRGDDGPHARMLGRGWTYVAVSDVNALIARAQAAGAKITMALTDQPHGSRDFSAVDLDGNQWNLGTFVP